MHLQKRVRQTKIFSIFLLLILFFISIHSNAAPHPKKIAKIIPNYAYILLDKDQYIGGYDESYLKRIRPKVRQRRGVKKAELINDGKEIRLEVVPKAFKAESVIAGIEVVHVEMRVPYERIEIRVEENATFPPKTSMNDENILMVEIGSDVANAINDSLHGVKIPVRMKCVGNLKSDKANEAILQRFEAEHLVLGKMAPFMAVGDFDGDKRQDLYLRLKGVPEIIVFQKAKNTFKAVPLSSSASDLASIPRCEQNMENFVRVVPNKAVKCMRADRRPAGFKGDALEIVRHNNSNKLLMWDGKKPAYCEPLGEGALPGADDE